MASLQALHARHAPLIVTPLGNDAIIRRRIPSARIEVGDWGDHFEIAPGARAYIVPAANTSSSPGTAVRSSPCASWSGTKSDANPIAVNGCLTDRKSTRLNSSH